MLSFGQLKAFKTAVRVSLEINPRRSFTFDELCQLSPDFSIVIDNCAPEQLLRLRHWLNQDDLDSPIVNMNTEAPRFGIMKAKKDTKRQKMHGLCDPTDIREKILEHNRIPYEPLSRDRNDVLNERRLIDIQVMNQLPEDQKEAYAISCGYESIRKLSDTLNPRNSTTVDYCCTSVWGLVKAIMHGQNTGGLKDYAGILMSIAEIYNAEKRKALEVANDRSRVFSELKTHCIGSLEAKMDLLLSKADQIIDQNVDLKESNDRMEQRQIVMARDIGTLISLFNNTAYTPGVVKQIVELHGGANNNGSFMIDGDKPWEHVEKCKLIFISSWYNASTRRLVIRVAARNFNTVGEYYKDIEKFVQREAIRHSHTIEYRGTRVVALCDQDVNAEYSTFDPVMRAHGARNASRKSKVFEVVAMAEANVDNYLTSITTELRNAFQMRHQAGVRKLLEDTTLDATQRAQIIQIRDQHTMFNQHAMEWCQMFISGCIDHLRSGMVVNGETIAFPRMNTLAKIHRVEGTDWRAMDVMKYAMTMFKICIRDFSRNEYIREIIAQEMES